MSSVEKPRRTPQVKQPEIPPNTDTKIALEPEKMDKSAKLTRKEQLLLQLQELENENLEDIANPDDVNDSPEPVKTETITAPKKRQGNTKPRTEKQMEAFQRAIMVREENRKARDQERKRIEEEQKKILHEKMVKKAISLKKKEIKKQAILDEISDDDTPIEKVKKVAEKVASRTEVEQKELPAKPQGIKLVFI